MRRVGIRVEQKHEVRKHLTGKALVSGAPSLRNEGVAVSVSGSVLQFRVCIGCYRDAVPS